MDDWKRVGPTGWTSIEYTVADGVGVLRMARPAKRNALSALMCAEMTACLDGWRRDDAVAVVVLVGDETCFSAGMDFVEYLGQPPEDRYEHMEVFHRLYGGLLDYPKPTIAAVAGPTLAGGCDLACHCDIRIVADNTVLALPQPKLGIHSYYSALARIIGPGPAKLMFFTGDRIDAREAARLGFADRLVPAGTVESEALAIAGRMAALGTEMQKRMTEVAHRSAGMDPTGACAYETAMYRDVCQGDAARERIAAALSGASVTARSIR